MTAAYPYGDDPQFDASASGSDVPVNPAFDAALSATEWGNDPVAAFASPAQAVAPTHAPVGGADVHGQVIGQPDEATLAAMEHRLRQYPTEVQVAIEALIDRIGEDESSEVILNGPAEVLVKTGGHRWADGAIVFPDAVTYHAVINEFILPFCDTIDRIDGTNVLVEGQLELPALDEGVPPMLARVHILAPPLTPYAKVTIAKRSRYDYNLDNLALTGSLTPAMADYLKAITRARLTVVVSGATGSGKTTLLQAMTHYYDGSDRVIVVEDTPELRIPIADVVYLNSGSVKPGQLEEGRVTIEWLVRQAQRMRMDRVVVGEVRGAEMYEFLLAANSGADGSATTIHADSPRRALDKMLALAAKGASATQEMTIRREIAATVDVIVQTSIIDNRHVVTAIEEVAPNLTSNGVFSTQTIFKYDKTLGAHIVESAPSDGFRDLLATRNVAFDPAWLPNRAGHR